MVHIFVSILFSTMCFGQGLDVPVGGMPAKTAELKTKPASKSEVNKTNFRLSYFGELYGPSLGALRLGDRINPENSQLDTSDSQRLENSLSLEYYVNENVYLGPTIDFNLYFGSKPDSIMQDVGLAIGTPDLIGGRYLKMSSDFVFTISCRQVSVKPRQPIFLNIILSSVTTFREAIGLRA